MTLSKTTSWRFRAGTRRTKKHGLVKGPVSKPCSTDELISYDLPFDLANAVYDTASEYRTRYARYLRGENA